MRRLAILLVGALLALGVVKAPAQAAMIGLDPSPTDTGSFAALKGPSTGALYSTSFTLTSMADVTVDVLALGVGGLGLDLYSCTTSNCSSKALVSGTGATGGSVFLSGGSFSYAGLQATTTYLIQVTGVVPFIGVVLGQIAATAVTPIPPALLMFLTAILALGGFAWRGRRSGAIAAAA